MSAKQWSIAQARNWHERTSWLRGCNYLPADCCNRIAFWQELDFEQHLATMDREVELMSSIGFNSIRVILEFIVWDRQHDGFMERFERVLQTSARHGIGVMVCFGNDCMMPKDDPEYRAPELGPQRYDWGYHGGQKNKHRPLPEGEVGYNPVMDNPETAERMYAMIHEIMAKYADDSRIVVWDLFNEPGNANRGEISLLHLKQFFVEARRQETLQPVTTGCWSWPATHSYSAVEQFALENSDVVSYHNYWTYESNIAQIVELRKFGRPLLNTEWLCRGNHNDIQELFPLFFLEKIGCWNWGFVAGLSQTYEPVDACFDIPLSPEGKSSFDFTKWMHDLFRPSLRPYDPEEIALIRRITRLADGEENALSEQGVASPHC